MENEWKDHPKRRARKRACESLSLFLFVSWLLVTAVAWISFELAPVGVLATADVGNLVAIQGSRVTTTDGYFQVSAYPSAMRGIPLNVIRTNSPWSDTGLQLCTAHIAGEVSWCSDISDGYAGKLSETSFARRAWPAGVLTAMFLIALGLTLFGWFPAAVIAVRASLDGDDQLTAAN